MKFSIVMLTLLALIAAATAVAFAPRAHAGSHCQTTCYGNTCHTYCN